MLAGKTPIQTINYILLLMFINGEKLEKLQRGKSVMRKVKCWNFPHRVFVTIIISTLFDF